MSITVDTYDQLKIDKLKLSLQTQADKGAPRYYEIFVDNLKAVHKTNDITEFDSYENYMSEDTERVRVLIYSTNAISPRNDQYTYKLKKAEEPKQATVQVSQGLSGVEIEQRIEDKIERYKEKAECDQVKKELEQTKIQLKEAEEYSEKIEAELTQYKGKKLLWGNVNLGELASVVVEGMVRRNPQLLAKIPGGEALAGIIEQDNIDKASTPIAQPSGGEMSFKRRETTTEEAVVLTEEERGYLNFMRGLAESFDQDEILILTKVITKLEEDSTQLRPVAELLNITVDESPKPPGKE
jgi:hypothetical protein